MLNGEAGLKWPKERNKKGRGRASGGEESWLTVMRGKEVRLYCQGEEGKGMSRAGRGISS